MTGGLVPRVERSCLEELAVLRPGLVYTTARRQVFLSAKTQIHPMKPLVVSLGFLEFPLDYTADGGNRSPRITLKDLEAGAVSVAIMVFNPFIKSCCSFTPWIIWNLPPAPVIPEGIPKDGRVTLPISAVQGITDYGITGYTGPQPPPGETHRYQFRVYVLDILLDLPPGSDKHSLVAAMDGHMIQYGETVAICTR
jgi:Raf kinase inhibitor-like YbhB/YbcL family protein